MARFKRTLFFFGVIGIAAIIIGIGYFLRYRNEEVSVNVAGNPPPLLTGENPPINGAGAGGNAGGTASSSTGPGIILSSGETSGLVSDKAMLDYYVSSDGSIVLIQPDGQVYKISQTDNILLSSIPIANITAAAFSGDGKKILIGFGDNQMSVFDVQKQNWTPLQVSADSFPEWSPHGERLAYFSRSGDKENLFISEGGSSQPRETLSLHAEDLEPVWLDETRIILKGKESAFAAVPYFVFNTKTSSFSQLLKDAKGLDVLWSSGKDAGLAFSVAGGGNRVLELIDKSSNVAKTINFTTLPSVKCVYGAAPPFITSSSPFYAVCAVPRGTGALAQATLPDDYFKKALFTSDDFLRIDLETGDSQNLYVAAPGSVDATKLRIANGGVYFINRLDQKLYMINLGTGS